MGSLGLIESIWCDKTNGYSQAVVLGKVSNALVMAADEP